MDSGRRHDDEGRCLVRVCVRALYRAYIWYEEEEMDVSLVSC